MQKKQMIRFITSIPIDDRSTTLDDLLCTLLKDLYEKKEDNHDEARLDPKSECNVSGSCKKHEQCTSSH
jgi:hypothetical protein